MLQDEELPKIVARRFVDRRDKSQSGCGIASFVIGLFSATWFAVLLGVHAKAFLREDVSQLQNLDLLLVLVVIVLAPLSVLGFCLGVAGTAQSDRRRSLAWYGILLNFIPAAALVFALLH